MNLSIKNVPDELAERLRERARRAHRSLQGELMTILEDAVGQRARLTPGELFERVRRSGLSTPDEATGWVRTDRERR